MVDNRPKLRVAVVGGGSVGLSLAVYLVQLARCEVHLFEGASAFTEIGAGIDIAWNAIQVYKEMRISDEVYELAGDSLRDASIPWFEVTYGDGRNGLMPFCALRSPGKSAKLHRADLLNLLISKLPKENVCLRKHLTTYDQLPEGGVRLHFRDGTTFEADVLVGADGIKSTVRNVMYADNPDEAKPTWSGSVAYRALLPIEEVVAKLGETGRKPTFHIVQFPIAQNTVTNLVCFVSSFEQRSPPYPYTSWIQPSSASEVLQDFADFAPAVKDMLAGVSEVRRWGIFEVPRIGRFVHGVVALIGDAAHASTPHGGNGASQGIEDVHMLATLLSHPRTTKSTVELALKAYDLVRRPRAQEWQDRAYNKGLVYELALPMSEDDEARIVEALDEPMQWVWGVDIHQQLERAVNLFKEDLKKTQE